MQTIVKELVIMRMYLAESLASFGDIILDEKMANFIPARAGYEIGNRFSKETGYLLKQNQFKNSGIRLMPPMSLRAVF